MPRIACAGPEIGVYSTLAFDGDPEHRSETVEAIQRFLHPQVVRDGLLWNQIEPVRGRRNWSRTDSIVEKLRAAGIEPLLVVVRFALMGERRTLVDAGANRVCPAARSGARCVAP